VIVYQAIRRAIEAGRREFDFLGGNDLYKKQLALASRPLVELRLARPVVAERARLLVERSKVWLRPFWRWLRCRGANRLSAHDET
jgi:CelD/BcsL family acetyltransferase involved in cellulose biosynthesis